jgi:hypothetical protein
MYKPGYAHDAVTSIVADGGTPTFMPGTVCTVGSPNGEGVIRKNWVSGTTLDQRRTLMNKL